jgi:hypothetical protein
MTRPKPKQRRKPTKPYRSFPLTPHNNGQWCKKIRGKVHFFGVWSDPQGAVENYRRVAADLHAGREPPLNLAPAGLTVKNLCNRYLTYQLDRAASGEITARWFDDCRRVRPRSAVSVLSPRCELRFESPTADRSPDADLARDGTVG